MNIARKFLAYIRQHEKPVIITAATLLLLGELFVLINFIVIGRYDRYLVDWDELPSNSSTVGVVLGGGIENGKPRPLLKDRLDTGAELLAAGKVRRLLLSGDNRFVHYNEPQVMYNYLVREKGIDPGLIQLDNAGRSTYETCERTKKVFGLEKAIFISESTHLPRAVYLCRSFGIEAYGHKSDGESSAGLRVGQRFREILARTKASINIYLVGENTVLGEKIAI